MATTGWQPEKILEKHVLGAAKKWDSAGRYLNFKNSLKYDVIIQGNRYPPKAICASAHELATGVTLTSEEFRGAIAGPWLKRLKDLGFAIEEKLTEIDIDPEVGSVDKLSLETPEVDFYMEVAEAGKLKPEIRAEQLAKLENEPPERILTQIYRYKRSALVVAERLSRANGICGECSRPAPFTRKKDGSPFLHVHHVLPLSKGGFDTVENTIAVCPNCHCETHDKMDLDALSD